MKKAPWLAIFLLFGLSLPAICEAQSWSKVAVNGDIEAGTWPSGRGWNRLHSIGNGKFIVQDSMNPCGDPFSNALWEYDITTNTMKKLWWSGAGAHQKGDGCPQPQVVTNPNVINKPGPGDRHPFGQNDYDPSRQEYGQFGGVEDQGNCDGTGKGSCAYHDSWFWSFVNNKWTQGADMPPLLANKDQAAVAYDARADEYVIYGGTRGGSVDRNTWTYRPSTNLWVEVGVNNGPSARLYQTMFYDSLRNHVVMFGGQLNNGTPLSDMWYFDSINNIWVQIVQNGPLPPATRFPPIALDTANGLYYFYDGTNNTFTFDTTTGIWTHTAIQGGPVLNPDKQNSRSMDYDPLTSTLLMKDLSSSDSPQVLWQVKP